MISVVDGNLTESNNQVSYYKRIKEWNLTKWTGLPRPPPTMQPCYSNYKPTTSCLYTKASVNSATVYQLPTKAVSIAFL